MRCMRVLWRFPTKTAATEKRRCAIAVIFRRAQRRCIELTLASQARLATNKNGNAEVLRSHSLAGARFALAQDDVHLHNRENSLGRQGQVQRCRGPSARACAL